MVRGFSQGGARTQRGFFAPEPDLLLAPPLGVGFLVNQFLFGHCLIAFNHELEELVDSPVGIKVHGETVRRKARKRQRLFKSLRDALFQGAVAVNK